MAAPQSKPVIEQLDRIDLEALSAASMWTINNIVWRLSYGFTRRELARIYDVPPSTITTLLRELKEEILSQLDGTPPPEHRTWI